MKDCKQDAAYTIVYTAETERRFSMPRRGWIFVTGGSRGVGAALVYLLVLAGYNVVFVYREKLKKANEVLEQARAAVPDAKVIAIQCDITKAEDLERLVGELEKLGVAFSGLVLNASGGLEPKIVEADPSYPMKVNRDAQVAVLQALWKFLAGGAHVIFVTSHWAYKHGEVEMPSPEYGVIAESKGAGQQAITVLIPALDAELPRRVALIIVTGDMIVGSPTVNLMERRYEGLTTRRAAAARAPLPTIETMAYNVLAALVDQSMLDQHVLVVGGALKTLTPLGVSEPQ